MPLVENISDILLKETVTRAVVDVFSTMLNQTAILLPEDPMNDRIDLNALHVVGTVGFIGDIKGLIYLYFDARFAEKCAGDMLGMDKLELIEAGDDVVNDAIGELTNMTVGGFKNQLSDKGFPCRLTIPAILRGCQFTIEPIQTAIRRVYRFEVNGHRLTADLMMQPGD
jgi:chemotaxis protein CheX